MSLLSLLSLCPRRFFVASAVAVAVAVAVASADPAAGYYVESLPYQQGQSETRCALSLRVADSWMRAKSLLHPLKGS